MQSRAIKEDKIYSERRSINPLTRRNSLPSIAVQKDFNNQTFLTFTFCCFQVTIGQHNYSGSAQHSQQHNLGNPSSLCVLSIREVSVLLLTLHELFLQNMMRSSRGKVMHFGRPLLFSPYHCTSAALNNCLCSNIVNKNGT